MYLKLGRRQGTGIDMGVALTVRSWAQEHDIDYYSEITKDHKWLLVRFSEESTYTLFLITYKHNYEIHVCM